MSAGTSLHERCPYCGQNSFNAKAAKAARLAANAHAGAPQKPLERMEIQRIRPLGIDSKAAYKLVRLTEREHGIGIKKSAQALLCNLP